MKYETKFKIDGVHRSSLHYVLREWVWNEYTTRGLRLVAAANALGISKKHLEQLLDGAKPISVKIAAKLGYRPVNIFKKIA